jgi:hypothetical protein
MQEVYDFGVVLPPLHHDSPLLHDFPQPAQRCFRFVPLAELMLGHGREGKVHRKRA